MKIALGSTMHYLISKLIFFFLFNISPSETAYEVVYKLRTYKRQFTVY